MNYGIILFIYNRPQCTKKVLDSLKENNIQELYVFQDGLGKEEDCIAWKENEKLIRNINWCTVYFTQNKRKAKSLDAHISNRIEEVFCEREALIIIEDDCVLSNDCIKFMESCLEKYKDNQKVMEICGWLEPITIPNTYKSPLIATPRAGGQVWGTWKDRWESLKKDYDIIRRIGDTIDNNDFSILGCDIKKLLTEDVKGLLGTWDLYWAINIFVKGGYSIRPVFNKVYNIGFEYPGTHTSGYSPFVVPISTKKLEVECLPDTIQIEDWTRKEMGKFYEDTIDTPLEVKLSYYRYCLQKWLKLKQQGKRLVDYFLEYNTQSLVIYGISIESEMIINEIKEYINIEYILVTRRTIHHWGGV